MAVHAPPRFGLRLGKRSFHRLPPTNHPAGSDPVRELTTDDSRLSRRNDSNGPGPHHSSPFFLVRSTKLGPLGRRELLERNFGPSTRGKSAAVFTDPGPARLHGESPNAPLLGRQPKILGGPLKPGAAGRS
eukprot:9147817-Pyramimonas_sp.AAC.1